MKKYICFILVLFLFVMNGSTVFAEENTDMDTDALPSGISYSDIESEIDSYVKENESTTAAVSVGVFKNDKVILEKAYGKMDVENSLVNNSDSVFEWGSCTKLIVWTSVMQLVEQGKIDLNQDIKTYLPEGFFKKLAFDKPITMLNLMNHNAGWQETVTDLFHENKSEIKSLGDALQYTEPEQIFEPGTIVAYSNWGAALAGYIVERVSGQSFDTYVQEHVFKPLGMEHTALNADLSDNTWVMQKRESEKCYSTEMESLGTCHYYISMYPAGNTSGTLNDFMKFAQAFVPKEGTKCVLFQKDDTLNKMLSPSCYFADGKTARLSHGIWTDEFSVPVMWHNGGTIGSSSWLAFDPESGTGVVILTNQAEESVYNCGLLMEVFGEAEHETNPNSQDVSGMYVSARTCFKGYSKLYSLLCHMQLAKDKEGEFLTKGSEEVNLQGIGTNQYTLHMGELKQFQVFENTLADGTRILQYPGNDYIEVNGYGFLAKIILLLLFAVVILISILFLPINIVRLIKHNVTYPLLKYRTALNISVIISAIMYAYLAISIAGGVAAHNTLRFSVMVNALCAIVPIVYAVLLAVKWRKLDCSKRQRFFLILSAIGSLIMTINTVFWDGYIFW